MLPLVLDTVKGLINEEMDAVVEKLKEEEPAEVAERGILGLGYSPDNSASVLHPRPNCGMGRETRGTEHAQRSYKGK